ncbi:MAG TPA: maltotransferase domain-containing protein, partial [Actinomycetota bacterium]|nr:maltotransferase domain-containing protein [Actinomycetota bacterium]
MRATEGRKRVVIEGVKPEIDSGRFPIKRVRGEDVAVEADAFADGHDLLGCALLWRRDGDEGWVEVPMDSLPDDRWRGRFTVEELGRYRYSVRAWVDRFATWRRDLAKRAEAGQDLAVELQIGLTMVTAAVRRATGPERTELRTFAKRLQEDGPDAVEAALDPTLASLMSTFGERRFPTTYPRELQVVVDRELAGFGAWYELFPRSTGPARRHGTFDDVIARLPYVAGMGFDVLYLPPIHPIGTSFRKGPNNALTAGPEDPGSPW